MGIASAANPKWVSINVLVIALWFGLVAGLLEGIGSLALLSLGRLEGVWVEILWVSPLFDALLFGAAGALLALAYIICRHLPVVTLAVFLFSSLTLLVWLELALPEGVHTGALLLLSAGMASVFTRWFHRHRDASLQFWQRSLPLVTAIALMVVAAVQVGFWWVEATS